VERSKEEGNPPGTETGGHQHGRKPRITFPGSQSTGCIDKAKTYPQAKQLDDARHNELGKYFAKKPKLVKAYPLLSQRGGSLSRILDNWCRGNLLVEKTFQTDPYGVKERDIIEDTNQDIAPMVI